MIAVKAFTRESLIRQIGNLVGKLRHVRQKSPEASGIVRRLFERRSFLSGPVEQLSGQGGNASRGVLLTL